MEALSSCRTAWLKGYATQEKACPAMVLSHCHAIVDREVLTALGTVLHPEHGSLVMNLHGGGLPSQSALLALFSKWLPFASKLKSSGYHESTEKGQAVHQIASTLRLVVFTEASILAVGLRLLSLVCCMLEGKHNG